MSTIIKKISKNLVLAIDWAAAEYDYLEDLKAELRGVEEKHDRDDILRGLKKAAKILHYVALAERRAYRFEKEVGKELEKLLAELEGENLSVDLITGFRQFIRQFKIEEEQLVKLTSFYEGTLEEELDKARALEEVRFDLETVNLRKAEEVHNSFLHILHGFEHQVEEAEEWIKGLEATLKEAKQLLEKLPEANYPPPLKEGYTLLKRYGFPIEMFPREAFFMAQHPKDIKKIIKAVGRYASQIFEEVMPTLAKLGLIRPEYWQGVVVIATTAADPTNALYWLGKQGALLLGHGKRGNIDAGDLGNLVKGFVALLKVKTFIELDYWESILPFYIHKIMKPEYWEGIVVIDAALGKKARRFIFTYGLPTCAASGVINEKNWPVIVKIAVAHKGKNFFDEVSSTLEIPLEKFHKLYQKQPIEFFRPGFKRARFTKTGFQTILLGGGFTGKVIVRIISVEAFESWKRAFEAEDLWKSIGFDYIPIEPILHKGEQQRAYKTEGNYKMVRVFTRVLGPTLFDYLKMPESDPHKRNLFLMKERIEQGLDKLGIKHGHLHLQNYCIAWHNEKPRMYAIDFDNAISPSLKES